MSANFYVRVLNSQQFQPMPNRFQSDVVRFMVSGNLRRQYPYYLDLLHKFYDYIGMCPSGSGFRNIKGFLDIDIVTYQTLIQQLGNPEDNLQDVWVNWASLFYWASLQRSNEMFTAVDRRPAGMLAPGDSDEEDDDRDMEEWHGEGQGQAAQVGVQERGRGGRRVHFRAEHDVREITGQTWEIEEGGGPLQAPGQIRQAARQAGEGAARIAANTPALERQASGPAASLSVADPALAASAAATSALASSGEAAQAVASSAAAAPAVATSTAAAQAVASSAAAAPAVATSTAAAPAVATSAVATSAVASQAVQTSSASLSQSEAVVRQGTAPAPLVSSALSSGAFGLPQPAALGLGGSFGVHHSPALGFGLVTGLSWPSTGNRHNFGLMSEAGMDTPMFGSGSGGSQARHPSGMPMKYTFSTSGLDEIFTAPAATTTVSSGPSNASSSSAVGPSSSASQVGSLRSTVLPSGAAASTAAASDQASSAMISEKSQDFMKRLSTSKSRYAKAIHDIIDCTGLASEDDWMAKLEEQYEKLESLDFGRTVDKYQKIREDTEKKESSLNSQIKELQSNLQSAGQELDSLKTEKIKVESDLLALRTEAMGTDESSKLAAQGLQSRISELESANAQLTSNISSLEKEDKAAQARIEALTTFRDNIQGENSKISAELNTAKTTIEALEKKCSSLEASLSTSLSAGETQNLRGELRTAQEALSSANAIKIELENRLSNLSQQMPAAPDESSSRNVIEKLRRQLIGSEIFTAGQHVQWLYNYITESGKNSDSRDRLCRLEALLDLDQKLSCDHWICLCTSYAMHDALESDPSKKPHPSILDDLDNVWLLHFKALCQISKFGEIMADCKGRQDPIFIMEGIIHVKSLRSRLQKSQSKFATLFYLPATVFNASFTIGDTETIFDVLENSRNCAGNPGGREFCLLYKYYKLAAHLHSFLQDTKFHLHKFTFIIMNVFKSMVAHSNIDSTVKVEDIKIDYEAVVDDFGKICGVDQQLASRMSASAAAVRGDGGGGVGRGDSDALRRYREQYSVPPKRPSRSIPGGSQPSMPPISLCSAHRLADHVMSATIPVMATEIVVGEVQSHFGPENFDETELRRALTFTSQEIATGVSNPVSTSEPVSHDTEMGERAPGGPDGLQQFSLAAVSARGSSRLVSDSFTERIVSSTPGLLTDFFTSPRPPGETVLPGDESGEPQEV